MQLPADLRRILDDMTASSSTADLSRAATAVSERYRRAEGNLEITSDAEALAYLATRFPATFCAAAKAMEQVALALPGFAPARVLDIGAGPGTATLAALTRWPKIENVALVEPNKYLRNAGEALLREQDVHAEWCTAQAENHAPAPADLVVSGYVLNELAGKNTVRETVLKMWRAAQGALLIIEPGTPAGQDIVLQAREILVKEGAFIAAPCPHAHACPIAVQWQTQEKWCHFSVRVERSKTHRAVKQDAVLGYEDEKFSYIAASRIKPETPRARIIGHPRGTKVIEVNLCTETGKYETVKVSKSADDYKAFRKADWGDGLV